MTTSLEADVAVETPVPEEHSPEVLEPAASPAEGFVEPPQEMLPAPLASDGVAESRPEPLTKQDYGRALAALQPELVTVQQMVRQHGLKVVVLVEGRDSGKRGSVVHRLAGALDARFCHVVSLGPPTARERRQWFLQRYVAHLPQSGEIVLFDGTWYGQSVLEYVSGLRDVDAYGDFLALSASLERVLTRSGFTILKYWLADGGDDDANRRELRTMAKRWGASDASFDSRATEAYDDARDELLAVAATEETVWRMIVSPDRRDLRLRCIRDLIADLTREE